MESKEKSIARSLLEIPVTEPETAMVQVTRLGLSITLKEIPYNKLTALRGTEDADLHYMLASCVSPNFKDKAWYQDHMGCPTPVDALKKLLRPGEVRAILRQCDTLNGYGPGAVIALEEEPDVLQDMAVGAALEDLEKN